MHEKKQILISFLIVNYQSLPELMVSLRDLNHIILEHNCEILVANNDVVVLPKTVQSIATNAVSTKVFDLPGNVGFGSANNYIAKKAQGTYLFFLNPDTYEFSDGLELLLRTIKDGVCDVIAPSITNSDGSPQMWSYGKAVTPLSIILSNVPIIAPSDKIIEQASSAQLMSVSWVTGAAFLLKKNTFLDLGGFDEGYFLYFEDIDLCKRLIQTGHKILISKEMVLKHKSGASAHDTISQKSHYYSAQDYYIRKHYGKIIAKVFSVLRRVTHPI